MEFFLKNLLFPVIIAIIGTQLWNYILERRRKSEEVYQKLYGPLRLYLSYVDALDVHLKKIINIQNIQTREEMEKLGRNDSQALSEYSIRNDMVKEWWRYVDMIKQLLETSAGFIKSTHEPLVYDFIKSYIARQHYGKIHYEKNIPNYLRTYFNKEDERLVSSVKKLKNAILGK